MVKKLSSVPKKQTIVIQSVESTDKDVVEDLILVAVNQAINNITKKTEDKMNAATGGMLGGGFPGM